MEKVPELLSVTRAQPSQKHSRRTLRGSFLARVSISQTLLKSESSCPFHCFAHVAGPVSVNRALLASQTVVTMLPSTPHVRNVYAEAGGILPALRKLPQDAAQATLCIDSTTLDVDIAREIAGSVAKLGAWMVDAPVSGGVAGAKAGTLSFLVGGTQTAFEHAAPTLERMGKNIIYCGASGAGLAAKICNNLVLGVQQIVVSEAMLLGQKLGLEPKVLASVVNSSTGACWASSVNNPVPGAVPDKSPPCERDYEGGFATRLMLKVCHMLYAPADCPCRSPNDRIWVWRST